MSLPSQSECVEIIYMTGRKLYCGLGNGDLMSESRVSTWIKGPAIGPHVIFRVSRAINLALASMGKIVNICRAKQILTGYWSKGPIRPPHNLLTLVNIMGPTQGLKTVHGAHFW